MVTNRGFRSGKLRTRTVGTGKAMKWTRKLLTYCRGPNLLTCGPWKPTFLEAFLTRIEDLSFEVALSDTLSEVTISMQAEINPVETTHKVEFKLYGPDGVIMQSQTVHSKKCRPATSAFHINSPQLWYPAGNGAQPIYTVVASVLGTADVISCTSAKRIGIRSVELIQRPSHCLPGSTFFQINKVLVFCRGSNWIPADMLLHGSKETNIPS